MDEERNSAYAPLCVALGEGLNIISINQPATFKILSVDSDGNDLTHGGEPFSVSVVRIEGPPIPTDQTERAPVVEIEDRGNGIYSVSYTVFHPGEYDVLVTLNGENIEESPFLVLARDSSAGLESDELSTETSAKPAGQEQNNPDHSVINQEALSKLKPELCVALGDGLESAKTGEEAKFKILSVDDEGNDMNVGGAKFEVTVNFAGQGTAPEAKVVLEDWNTGIYEVRYVVFRAGEYSIRVRTLGKDIEDSPFKMVATGPDVTGGSKAPAAQVYAPFCVASGAGLSQCRVGTDSVFKILGVDENGDDMSTGGAKFDIKVMRSDGGDDESVRAEVTDPGTGIYDVRYRVGKEGEYMIRITLGGVPIEDSPFKVQVQAGGSESVDVDDEAELREQERALEAARKERERLEEEMRRKEQEEEEEEERLLKAKELILEKARHERARLEEELRQKEEQERLERQREEEEKKRAEEEVKRRAEEEEREKKRREEEAERERKRLEAEEAERKEKERQEEKKRKEAEEKRRRDAEAEEAARRKAEEEERERLRAVEEERIRRLKDEEERKKAEEERVKREKEEEERREREAEARRKQREAEEAARLVEEAKKREEEKKKQEAEAEERRKQAEAERIAREREEKERREKEEREEREKKEREDKERRERERVEQERKEKKRAEAEAKAKRNQEELDRLKKEDDERTRRRAEREERRKKEAEEARLREEELLKQKESLERKSKEEKQREALLKAQQQEVDRLKARSQERRMHLATEQAPNTITSGGSSNVAAPAGSGGFEISPRVVLISPRGPTIDTFESEAEKLSRREQEEAKIRASREAEKKSTDNTDNKAQVQQTESVPAWRLKKEESERKKKEREEAEIKAREENIRKELVQKRQDLSAQASTSPRADVEQPSPAPPAEVARETPVVTVSQSPSKSSVASVTVQVDDKQKVAPTVVSAKATVSAAKPAEGGAAAAAGGRKLPAWKLKQLELQREREEQQKIGEQLGEQYRAKQGNSNRLVF